MLTFQLVLLSIAALLSILFGIRFISRLSAGERFVSAYQTPKPSPTPPGK